MATALTDLGVLAARGGLRTSRTEQTLRVVVGPWSAARTADTALQRMEDGPRASGVFARPTPDGRRIDLLDPRGRATRSAGPGGGLIVATRDGEVAPTWAVTGTDEAGVAAAAQGLPRTDPARPLRPRRRGRRRRRAARRPGALSDRPRANGRPRRR